MIIKLLRWFLVGVVFVVVFGCGSKHVNKKKEDTRLIIFHAGSLSNPMKEIIAGYKKLHPQVEILTEIGGSVECARKITELNKPCDVFVSADYKVIENLLIPKYASWNISFASNEMVIAYQDNSVHSSQINSDNWMSVLSDNKVRIGRSDPNSDPCGYRTVLLTQLAERYYHRPGLSKRLLQNSQRDIRPKEVDLLAMLETGNVDYLYIYKSIAIQHQLKYISLPPEINLSNSDFDSLYATASIAINGSAPGETKVQKGESMQYSVTMPLNGKNKPLAEDFVAYFLSKDLGLNVIRNHGQQIFTPLKIQGYESLPPSIKAKIGQ